MLILKTDQSPEPGHLWHAQWTFEAFKLLDNFWLHFVQSEARHLDPWTNQRAVRL